MKINGSIAHLNEYLEKLRKSFGDLIDERMNLNNQLHENKIQSDNIEFEIRQAEEAIRILNNANNS